MIKFYLVRHCETEMNKSGVYYGWTDCNLNDTGLKQAYSLKNVIENIKFDFIISSPLLRALETTKIITGLDEKEIIRDDRLRELNFGDWEGLHYNHLQQNQKVHWDKWCKDWKDTSPPKGESFNDIYYRIKDYIEDALEKYEDKKVLIVSHQGCLRLFPVILMNLQPEACWNYRFEQGTYSLLEIQKKHCVIRKINCMDKGECLYGQ